MKIFFKHFFNVYFWNKKLFQKATSLIFLKIVQILWEGADTRFTRFI